MASNTHDHRSPSGFVSTPLPQRKVAIPRLQKHGQLPGVAKDRRRVSRACTGCRTHKIKCTGERPQCKHCAATNRECVYVLERQDRLKNATDRCNQMAELLKSLQGLVGAEVSVKIAEVLDSAEDPFSELQQTAVAPSHPESDTYGAHEGRDYTSVDDVEDVDTYASSSLLDENLLENDRARATGFVGRSSEVQWLRAVALAQLERANDESVGQAAQRRASCVPGSEQVSFFSYWMDGENTDLEPFIQPYEMPPPEAADRLLQCYMLKVHDSFPILPRKPFEDQCRTFFRALHNGNAPRLSPKWQAILNIVFAIGARYSHLIKASWRADERDHLIYQARARTFGLNETALVNHSDLPQIQSLGLLAFYWLTVGQVSRAWKTIGTAIRSAHSLGLHVRNEDPSATAVKRELLARTWWSLYSLERTLSIITGRPSMIVDSYCSVPLPIPVPEEKISDEVEAAYRMRRGSTTMLYAASPPFSASPNNGFDMAGCAGATEPNSGSFFRAGVELSVITQQILISLYSVGTSLRTANEVQRDTRQLLQRLDQWATALPVEFNSQDPSSNLSTKFTRERMLLGFQFWSARILLTRPALAARRQPWKETKEASFSRSMADMCVEAAKTVVASLPDDPRPDWVFDQGPWWCIVHHLMQAISIFLLALSHPSSVSHEGVSMAYFVEKALRWLEAMQDPIARRAHNVALALFQNVIRQQSVESTAPWATEPLQGVAGAANVTRQAVADTVLDAYYPTPFVTMAPPSAVDSYGPYDAPVNFSSYPTAPDFNRDFYMAR